MNKTIGYLVSGDLRLDLYTFSLHFDPEEKVWFSAFRVICSLETLKIFVDSLLDNRSIRIGNDENIYSDHIVYDVANVLLESKYSDNLSVFYMTVLIKNYSSTKGEFNG